MRQLGRLRSWAVPADAVSGIYIGRLVRTDTGGASHIVFVVRDDASESKLLFQTSDTTWQAYNNYGGSFIEYPDYGYPTARAFKGSYNRPFLTRRSDDDPGLASFNWLFHAEYPMVRWLEANGYDVSYFTGVDSDRRGSLIQNHKVFLSVGHDEYWSGQQRANVEAAGMRAFTWPSSAATRSTGRSAGRPASTAPGRPTARWSATRRATRTRASTRDATVWTGSWRDARSSPPADGGRPENALTGTLFGVAGVANDAIPLDVPEADGKMRFWRNTPVASLAPGTEATLGDRVVGYEFDEEIDNGSRPAGLIRLSSTTTDPLWPWSWATTSSGVRMTIRRARRRMSLTLYKHASSGALVFSAGTVQWSWGLDGEHDNGSSTPDASMRQATVNLLADMGVQPATLQAGLHAGLGLDRRPEPPVSDITSPAGRRHAARRLPGDDPRDGDRPGPRPGRRGRGVGGRRRHRGTRRAGARPGPTPSRLRCVGSYTIRSRAVDDSGNLETPGAGRTIVIEPDTTGTDRGVDVSRPNGATGVAAGANVTATFSEPINPATVNGTHLPPDPRERARSSRRSSPGTRDDPDRYARPDGRPRRTATPTRSRSRAVRAG